MNKQHVRTSPCAKAGAGGWAIAVMTAAGCAAGDPGAQDDGGLAARFAGQACDALRISDGDLWSRWCSALAGGPRGELGDHGVADDETPRSWAVLASRIEDSEAIALAWSESVWPADAHHTAATATAGANATDCWVRHGATRASVTGLTRLHVWQIGYLCWSGWHGI